MSYKLYLKTYVRPELHHIGHLNRRVKHIYFKAFNANLTTKISKFNRKHENISV